MLENKVNELTDSGREIEVKLNYDEIKSDIEKEIKKRSKKIEIPGFRKGKVPLNMIKKMYGDALDYEASEKVATDWFWKVIEKEDIKPIGRPKLTDLDFKPEESLSFKVEYEIMPEVEVKGYTDNKIEIPDFNATDKEVDQEIENILKSNRTLTKAEKVEDKNFVVKAELQRLNEEGEPFPESSPEVLDIDLSNENVHEDIINGVIGKKEGEKFNFKFTDERTIKNDKGEDENISEEYHYEGTVKEINKGIEPELNEEFIKKITKDKISSEEELRKQIKEDVQKYYDQKTDEILLDRLIKTIVEKNDFTPPSVLIENMLSHYLENEEKQAKQRGLPAMDKEEAKKRFKDVAELDVKWYLLKEAIKKKEDIKISEDDMKEMAKKEAEKTGLPEEKLINYYKTSNYDEKLLDEKLIEFLKEKNDIKRIDPEKLANKEKKKEGK